MSSATANFSFHQKEVEDVVPRRYPNKITVLDSDVVVSGVQDFLAVEHLKIVGIVVDHVVGPYNAFRAAKDILPVGEEREISL